MNGKANWAVLEGAVRKGKVTEKFASMRVDSVDTVETPTGAIQAKYSGNVATFGAANAALVASLADGEIVRAEGRMRNRSYERDGSKVWVTELVAETIARVAGARKPAPADELPPWAQ